MPKRKDPLAEHNHQYAKKLKETTAIGGRAKVNKLNAKTNDLVAVSTNSKRIKEVVNSKLTAPITSGEPISKSTLEQRTEMNNPCNQYKVGSVKYLQNINFPKLPLPKQLTIKTKGRPTPELILEQSYTSRQGNYNRKFNADVYEKYDWLCGCELTTSLFCFPCLLYGHYDAWTRTGIVDLGHLTQKLKKHAECARHIKNSLELGFLGYTAATTDNKNGLTSERDMCKHNDEVRRNHDNVIKIIECIRFCGAHELKIQEGEKANTDLFRDLLQFHDIARPGSKGYYDILPSFYGCQAKIQAEIQNSILMVCRDHIEVEISKSDFVCVIFVHIMQIVDKFQIAIIFRYELEGRVYERFWGIIHAGGDYLFNCIKEKLDTVFKTDREKLIAQVYDGGIVTKLAGRLQAEYPFANPVDYYGFTEDSLMEQAASVHEDARSFFVNLNLINMFFEENSVCLELLQKVYERTCSKDTKMDLSGSMVKVVHENKTIFAECFDELRKVDVANPKIATTAANFLILLDDDVFVYWLQFFDQVKMYLDMLKIKLKEENRSEAFEFFDKCVQKILYDSAMEINADDPDEPPPKRHKISVSDMGSVATKVSDSLAVQVRNRYTFLAYRSAEKLLNCELFSTYMKTFPTKELDEVCRVYTHLNKVKLQTELNILYERKDIQELRGVLNLYNTLMKRNMRSTLLEVFTLLKVVLVTPMPTTEDGRTCTILARIKAFLSKQTTDDKSTSVMALLSVEKDLVNDLPDFNDKVLKRFCSITTKHKEFNFVGKEKA